MDAKRRQPLEVFYSYAHEDEPLRKELEKHLHILELQGLIKGWNDRDINAGIEWTSEINIHLNSAHIILLLVSPDFLSSRYCYSVEMKRAMERHYSKEAYVIPIILRPIYWQGAPFDKLQVLPIDAKPVTSWSNLDDAFLNVTIGIRQAIERFPLLSSIISEASQTKAVFQHTESIWNQDIPSCPYRSLYAFREQDAPFFFGRDIFIEQLIEKVRQRPFVAVIGPSGSGKSSLVLAGLLPRLRYEGRWQIATFRPSERPFYALASVLISLLEPDLDEIDRLVRIGKLAEPLQRGDISLYDVIERITDRQGNRLLLFADQFEELYTRCQKREDREQFLDSIINMLRLASQSQNTRFTFVITLRADFLGYALQHRSFADELQFADLKISSMNRQELYDVIVRPAKLLQIKIESGLTERIIDDVYLEPGTLPLLEFTLASLWTKQQEGTLTHSSYQEIGGVENALADYAEDVFAKLNVLEQQQARQVFVQLVHPGVGTGDTRRVAFKSQIKEEHWGLVLHLADARLVICGRDEATKEEMVEVVHEALINKWKRLRDWMIEDREFRLWQDRLRLRMSDSDFLRGTALEEAGRWLKERFEELGPEEQVFIEASYDQQIRDVETQKAALVETQKAALNEMSELMEQRLAITSLELKTPLSLIKAIILLGRRRLNRMLPSNSQSEELNQSIRETQGLLERADKQVSVLSHLVNELSDIASVKAGRLQVRTNIERMNLVSIVQQIIQEKQINLPQRSISFKMSSVEEDVFIVADTDRISQVIEQYIENAHKFSRIDRPIEITLKVEKEAVSISVRDEGPGLSYEDQEKIWEQFYYVQGVEVQNGSRIGLGLGLYICRVIVEQHQGVAGVQSHLGEGSTFWFTLPIAKKTSLEESGK